MTRQAMGEISMPIQSCELFKGTRTILPVRQRSWDCPFMQSDAGKTRCATGPTGGEMTGDLACFFRRKTQARFPQSAVCREAGWLQGLPVNGLYGRIQAARKNMNQRFLSILFV